MLDLRFVHLTPKLLNETGQTPVLRCSLGQAPGVIERRAGIARIAAAEAPAKIRAAEMAIFNVLSMDAAPVCAVISCLKDTAGKS